MKYLLISFFIFFCGGNLFGQPVVKIFAFEQESTPGNIPANVTDENGNAMPGKDWKKKEYRIFLSFKNIYRITPVQIFIRKKRMELKSFNLTKTPVEYTDNSIPSDP